MVREKGLQEACLPMRVCLAGIARRAMIGAEAFPSNGRFTLLQLLCHDRRPIGLFSILVRVFPQRSVYIDSCERSRPRIDHVQLGRNAGGL